MSNPTGDGTKKPDPDAQPEPGSGQDEKQERTSGSVFSDPTAPVWADPTAPLPASPAPEVPSTSTQDSPPPSAPPAAPVPPGAAYPPYGQQPPAGPESTPPPPPPMSNPYAQQLPADPYAQPAVPPDQPTWSPAPPDPYGQPMGQGQYGQPEPGIRPVAVRDRHSGSHQHVRDPPDDPFGPQPLQYCGDRLARAWHRRPHQDLNRPRELASVDQDWLDRLRGGLGRGDRRLCRTRRSRRCRRQRRLVQLQLRLLSDDSIRGWEHAHQRGR